MCTLTFVPFGEDKNGFILTSNRDESPKRPTIYPRKYKEDDTELFYPKDEVAGGTWLGISSQKRLVCLLNGAFSAHQRKSNYRMSRGLVVKELLMASGIYLFVENFDFIRIEPFTVVIVEWTERLTLTELIWDGSQKYLRNLPIEPHIWSAPMLYSKAIRRQKEEVFEKFLSNNRITPETLWQLNKQFWLDRTQVKTISTTQFLVSPEVHSYAKYQDWLSGTYGEKTLVF